MPPSNEFLSGVIEGFYGLSWPHETRLAYVAYLQEAGLNTSIYCPKGDPFLRKRWPQDWPAQQWLQLHEISRAHRQAGLDWGVGLSPVELYRDYGRQQRADLKGKIERLMELQGSLVAILFDDMPGDLDGLASRQAEIVADVCDWADGTRVLVCPTYYSFDPVLEKYFGAMPDGYWPQLGAELPADVSIFWTGNKVCSEAISTADIQAINAQLGRSVLLWDNYPVNDGPVRSNFLYTSRLSQRPEALRTLLKGHLCNPMNQGVLSLPALAGLSELYGGGGLDDAALCRALGPQTWELLARDGALFQQQGLQGLGQKRCRELSASYGQLPGAAAQELVRWLNGEYAFDPACLTD